MDLSVRPVTKGLVDQAHLCSRAETSPVSARPEQVHPGGTSPVRRIEHVNWAVGLRPRQLAFASDSVVMAQDVVIGSEPAPPWLDSR